ncbi:hypothetical protein ACFLU6_06450 [Acidobacteriota bacterium]
MKKELKIFDKPRNVKIFFVAFFIVLGILLVADFFIKKHAAFHWVEAPGFLAAFGFGSFVLLIFVAKLLRFIVKRDEDYYD